MNDRNRHTKAVLEPAGVKGLGGTVLIRCAAGGWGYAVDMKTVMNHALPSTLSPEDLARYGDKFPAGDVDFDVLDSMGFALRLAEVCSRDVCKEDAVGLSEGELIDRVRGAMVKSLVAGYGEGAAGIVLRVYRPFIDGIVPGLPYGCIVMKVFSDRCIRRGLCGRKVRGKVRGKMQGRKAVERALARMIRSELRYRWSMLKTVDGLFRDSLIRPGQPFFPLICPELAA